MKTGEGSPQDLGARIRRAAEKHTPTAAADRVWEENQGLLQAILGVFDSANRKAKDKK